MTVLPLPLFQDDHLSLNSGERNVDQVCVLMGGLPMNIVPRIIDNSCIDIYALGCLKLFSVGRKPCSNSKTHVQIMKFMCRLNMGFGRRHWSMQHGVMCFVETKWPTLKKLCGFQGVFALLMLFS